MLRKIKFKAKRVFDKKFVYGSYIEISCGIIDKNNQYHSIYINTLEQFTGMVDAEGNDIYSGDMLYSNDGQEVCFSYKWSPHQLYYYREGSIPNNTSIVINEMKCQIENFSLVKKELTKEQFIAKFFNKSLYHINSPKKYLQLQAIAISLGFKSEDGSINVDYDINSVDLSLLPPDENHNYNYFKVSSPYSPSCGVKTRNFDEMIKQHSRLYSICENSPL